MVILIEARPDKLQYRVDDFAFVFEMPVDS
jgi:hypothetical protein